MVTTAAVLPSAPKHDPESVLYPHSLEAERATLGAALLHVTAADYITDALSPNSYFRRAHRWIFEAIRELRRKNIDADLLTIKNELGRVGKLDESGGPAYITALVDGVPRSTNVEHYASILRDLQLKRALLDYANSTTDLVVAGEHGSAALLADADRRLSDLQNGHIDGRLVTLKEGISAVMADMEYRAAHRGQLTGVETGFASINELTLGWQAGDLVIIAARPSIGKTSFVMNTAAAAAKAGSHVVIFSLEMRRRQLEYRMLSSLSGVPLSRILGGHMMGPDYTRASDAIGLMDAFDISIDDRSGQTVWEIRSACRRLKAERGLDLIIIDYVQLIPGSLDRRGASRNDEVTDISRRLKALADEVSAPVLLLSQLSRASDKRSDPRPKLSDLRESGALEQDADIVAFLHRTNHREGGLTKFIIEKQRNGPAGTLNLTFDRDIVTFVDGGDEPPEARKATPEQDRTGSGDD